MTSLTIMAAAAAAALAAGSAAYGFPPTPHLAPDDLIRVSGGCEPGWHLTPNGLCRRDAIPYAYRPYAYVIPPHAGRCWWTATPLGVRRVCAW